MNTVLTTFYHPDLGAVRGIAINGEPWLVCRDLAALLVGPHVEETEKVMRRHYGAKDITVPVTVSAGETVKVEKLLFVSEETVFRMIECTANRAWERYVAWFNDYVFPSLCQLNSARCVDRDAHRFYDTCADPLPPKRAPHGADSFFSLFE